MCLVYFAVDASDHWLVEVRACSTVTYKLYAQNAHLTPKCKIIKTLVAFSQL